jgi:NAD-dependent dihydropyrimidine dehydrogenase PreA subunit
MAKKKAVLNESKCDNSPFCPVVKVCPVKAATRAGGGGGFLGMFGGGGKVAIDAAKCTGCGVCVQYCPHGAVTMRKD